MERPVDRVLGNQNYMDLLVARYLFELPVFVLAGCQSTGRAITNPIGRGTPSYICASVDRDNRSLKLYRIPTYSNSLDLALMVADRIAEFTGFRRYLSPQRNPIWEMQLGPKPSMTVVTTDSTFLALSIVKEAVVWMDRRGLIDWKFEGWKE